MTDEQLDQALTEQERIRRRILWLERKANRLPLASNGRRKALREAGALAFTSGLIDRACSGQKLPKLPLGHSIPRVNRALNLIIELTRE